MKDVITGPGEYRMKMGKPWFSLAIIKGQAVGYYLDTDGTPIAGVRDVATGKHPGYTCEEECILPPAPVIDGPGPYETRDGGTIHVALVDDRGAHGLFSDCDGDFTYSTWDAKSGRYYHNPSAESERDIIRKRVSP